MVVNAMVADLNRHDTLFWFFYYITVATLILARRSVQAYGNVQPVFEVRAGTITQIYYYFPYLVQLLL
jgi:hypothetical protein